jgi:hypothetical protein
MGHLRIQLETLIRHAVKYPSMKKNAIPILIVLVGFLVLACGCSTREISDVTPTVTVTQTTAPVTTFTPRLVDTPFVRMMVSEASVKKFPDHCLWTFRGTLSNMGTGRMNDVIVIVTMTDRKMQYPAVTNQQQIGSIDPGSDRQFYLTATVSCEGDYHASIKYYGKDDAGKPYSLTTNL